MSLRTSCKISIEPPPPCRPHTESMFDVQLKTDNFLRGCFVINYCDKLHFTRGVPSVFTCVLGAQYDHLIETVLLSTNSIFLLRNKTNNYELNIIKASGLFMRGWRSADSSPYRH